MSDSETKQDILSEVTRFYLSSRDYNGIPVHLLESEFGIDQIRHLVTALLKEEKVCVVYGDYHPNPHIKALESEPVSEQLEKLDSEKFKRACVYATTNHLTTVVCPSEFEGRPFELRLALGEPQLSFSSFDLEVLERYRNDPRYYYRYNDTHGFISTEDEYFETNKLKKSDQILLETFGISFDKGKNAYVAAFLRYLSNLSPEHQLFWESKQVETETRLHPNYYRSSILGEFPQRISLYEAILMEMKTINRIAEAIGRPALFRSDYSGERRPREFGYLLRPTLKEYNDFIHLLDKMISENIDCNFFQNEVSLEIKDLRPDGKIEVKPKGSLRILEDWVRNKFETEDWTDIEEMFQTFREIRKLRQKPAHSVRENIFDQQLLRKQGELMKKVYRAIKTLRSVLHLYPHASSVQIDKHLRDGLLWSV